MTPHPSWFSHPWLSALLGLSWLLLQHSLSLFHLLSAVLIGLVVPRLLHGFLPTARPIKAGVATRLVAVVLWDIVVSNIAVARLVLGPMSRPRPAAMWRTSHEHHSPAPHPISLAGAGLTAAPTPSSGWRLARRSTRPTRAAS